MLKQTVMYEDFDGNPASEVLYFNLSRSELMELLPELLPEVQRLQAMFEGVQRDLTTDEVQTLLNFVKRLVELSYGERSADGKRFHKSIGLFEDFKQTAVYDEFLMGLFEDPNKANAFMTGVLPKQLLEEVQKTQSSPTPQVEESVPALSVVKDEPVKDDTPAYMREMREPTSKELQAMSRSELIEAMKWKSELNKTE